MKLHILAITGLFFIGQASTSKAQDRCSTMEYLKESEKLTENRLLSFEKWLESRLDAPSRKSSLLGGDSLLVIPLVVHIIHNGDELGNNENISASQVYAQIETLNKDYGRMNVDRFNTPRLFKNVAKDTRIVFKPALLSPEGNLLDEPGIHRVVAEREEWSVSQLDDEIKTATSWDPERYLNIWVADLQGSTLGYSSWPKEPGIVGVPQENAPPEEEGVVVSYHVFGSNYTERGTFEQLTDSRYDRGRTTTHEVGHYFGLLHPWGFTGGCGDDDFCDDTPTTSRNRDDVDFPCSFPDEQNTCSDGSDDLPDMFQNFMDYTADQCMNLFTGDQTDRMRAVITGAPRRASLLTSQVILPHAAPSSPNAIFLNDSVVSISWAENAANAATYAIERSESPTDGYAKIGETEYGTSTFYDTLVSGQPSYYRVKAENLAGATDYSIAAFSGAVSLPSAPTNLSGFAVTTDSVQLTWEATAQTMDKLILEWSFDAEAGFQVGKILPPETNGINLRGLLDSRRYYFRIKAENAAGSSGYSNVLAIETLRYPPEAPQNLMVDFLEDIRRFELSWMDDAEEITGYRIYRAANSPAVFEEIASINGGSAFFVDMDLEVPPASRFYYMVRAQNEGGISGFSNIAEFDAITGKYEETNKPATVGLFPNPTGYHSFFTAKGFPAGNLQLLLFNIAGKKVWELTKAHHGGDFKTDISVEKLDPGLYLLRVIHQSNSFTLKLLVE